MFVYVFTCKLKKNMLGTCISRMPNENPNKNPPTKRINIVRTLYDYELCQPRNGSTIPESYLVNHCELDRTKDTAVISRSSCLCSVTSPRAWASLDKMTGRSENTLEFSVY